MSEEVLIAGIAAAIGLGTAINGRRTWILWRGGERAFKLLRRGRGMVYIFAPSALPLTLAGIFFTSSLAWTLLRAPDLTPGDVVVLGILFGLMGICSALAFPLLWYRPKTLEWLVPPGVREYERWRSPIDELDEPMTGRHEQRAWAIALLALSILIVADVAFPWRLIVATAIAFVAIAVGRRRDSHERAAGLR